MYFEISHIDHAALKIPALEHDGLWVEYRGINDVDGTPAPSGGAIETGQSRTVTGYAPLNISDA